MTVMVGCLSTGIGGLVSVFEASAVSVAVTVALPTVLSVTENVFVPATSAALPGNVAAVSLELMATMSATFVTAFQFASTALMVTLKPTPNIWLVGVPV